MTIPSDNIKVEGGAVKRWLHTYIPANFNNIWKLTANLVTSGKHEAWTAMLYAFLGIVFTPLDWFLQVFEKRKYRNAPAAQFPQIFVCGAPRSGTTLVAQVLMKHLPVYYFNNLTSVFPRSPLTAQKLFGLFIKNNNQKIEFRSFYGRTSHPGSPNDALYFWDRWFGKERKKIPVELADSKKIEMKMFFNAVEAHSNKPLVNKNNSLNSYAHLVAPFLKNAYFVCLDRDPLYLAQSHLIASRFINADEKISYGVEFDDLEKYSNNHLEYLCRQITAHKALNQSQQNLIGRNRFRIVSYEDFCHDPVKIVNEIAENCLNISLDLDKLSKELKPFNAANRRNIMEEEFTLLQSTFDNLKSK